MRFASRWNMNFFPSPRLNHHFTHFVRFKGRPNRFFQTNANDSGHAHSWWIYMRWSNQIFIRLSLALWVEFISSPHCNKWAKEIFWVLYFLFLFREFDLWEAHLIFFRISNFLKTLRHSNFGTQRKDKSNQEAIALCASSKEYNCHHKMPAELRVQLGVHKNIDLCGWH